MGEIGKPRESEHECAYDGLSFKGADLPERYGGLGVSTATAEECRLACVKQVRNVCHYSTEFIKKSLSRLREFPIRSQRRNHTT